MCVVRTQGQAKYSHTSNKINPDKKEEKIYCISKPNGKEGLYLFSCNYPDPSKCLSPVLKTSMCGLHGRSLFRDGFVPSLCCPVEQVCTEKTLPQRNEEMYREKWSEF